MCQKYLSTILVLLLTVQPIALQAQDLTLPQPGVMVPLSQAYQLPILKGLKLHADQPFRFDFILDQGTSTSYEVKEVQKVLKYFLAALTIPEQDLWVNLSPYEKNRIIPDGFGQTEMGRDLLAQDYILKQITASLMYPEDAVGKAFWKKVYEQSRSQSESNIKVNTFNKVWIVPDQAKIYENLDTGTVYVVESHLKVMLDEDYLASQKNRPDKAMPSSQNTKIWRSVILPELEREVNTGAHFAPLRQIYQSLILATWYKQKIKDSLLSSVYADQRKIRGTEHQSSALDVQAIYERYIEAFKKGAYNYIKDDYDPIMHQTVPRKYFSGGIGFYGNLAMTSVAHPGTLPTALEVQADFKPITQQASKAMLTPPPSPIIRDITFDGGAQTLKIGHKDIRRDMGFGNSNWNYRYQDHFIRVFRTAGISRESQAHIFERLAAKGISPSLRAHGFIQENPKAHYAVIVDAIDGIALDHMRALGTGDSDRLLLLFKQILAEQLLVRDFIRSQVMIGVNVRLNDQRPKAWLVDPEESKTYSSLNHLAAYYRSLLQGDSWRILANDLKPVIQYLQAVENGSIGLKQIRRDLAMAGESTRSLPNELRFFSKDIFANIDPYNQKWIQLMINHPMEMMKFHLLVTRLEASLKDRRATNNDRQAIRDHLYALQYINTNHVATKDINRLIAALIGLKNVDSSFYLELHVPDSIWRLLLNSRHDLSEEFLQSIGQDNELSVNVRLLSAALLLKKNPKAAARIFIGVASEDIADAKLTIDFLAMLPQAESKSILKRLARQGHEAAARALGQESNLVRAEEALKQLIKSDSAEDREDLEALGNTLYRHSDLRMRAAQHIYAYDPAKAGAIIEKIAESRMAVDDVSSGLLNDLYKMDTPSTVTFLRQRLYIAKDSEQVLDVLAKMHCDAAKALIEEVAHFPNFPSIKTKANAIWGQTNDKGIEYLIETATTTQGSASRVGAIDGLITLSHKPEVASSLEQIAHDPKQMEDVRAYTAIKYLMPIRKEEAFAILRTVSQSGGNVENILTNTFRYLIKLATPDALEVLELFARVGSSASFNQLANRKSSGGLPILLGIAQDETLKDDIRLSAAFHLSKISDGAYASQINAVAWAVFLSEHASSDNKIRSFRLIHFELLTDDDKEKVIAWGKSYFADFLKENQPGKASEIQGRDVDVLYGLSQQDPRQARPVFRALGEVLVNEFDRRTVAGQGFGLGRFDVVTRRIGFIVAKYPRAAEEVFIPLCKDNPALTKALENILKAFPEAAIARIFEINIKWARFLKNHGGFERLYDPDYKSRVDRIATNINRERTSHPSERRLGEDDKNRLFDYLKTADETSVKRASLVFERYFYNSPDAFQIKLSDIRKLLDDENLSVEELQKIVGWIRVDPKQSLDEIHHKVRERLQRDNDDRRAQGQPLLNIDAMMRNFSFIISNLFVLDEQLLLLNQVLEAFKKRPNPKEELKSFLREIAQQQKFEDIDRIANQFQIPLPLVVSFRATALDVKASEKFYAYVLKKLKDDVQWTERGYQEMREVLQGLPAESIERIRQELIQSKTFTRDPNLVPLFEHLVGRSLIVPIDDGPKIPHIFLDPLLRVGASDAALDIFNSITAVIGAQTGTSGKLRNELYDAVAEFSALKDEQRGGIFSGILKTISAWNNGGPANANINHFVGQLKRLLRLMFLAATAQDWAKSDSNPVGMAALREHSLSLINDLKEGKVLVESDVDRFSVALSSMDADRIISTFEAKHIFVSEDDEKALKAYFASSEGLWRDHERRSLVDLLTYYFSRDYDFPPNVVQTMYDSLLAAANGKFKVYKYSSPEYGDFLQGVIEHFRAEMGSKKELTVEQRSQLDEILKGTAGFKMYETLMGTRGFDGLKAKILRVKEGWESTMTKDLENGTEAQLTDNFTLLLNIGNYPQSTSCQSISYADQLNFHLAGYVANGTVKALTLTNSKTEVLEPRRMIKLLLTSAGPVIFVEENKQFGVEEKGLKALYAIVDELSRRTGLPVVTSDIRSADLLAQERGEKKTIDFHPYASGRERVQAYSDALDYDSGADTTRDYPILFAGGTTDTNISVSTDARTGNAAMPGGISFQSNKILTDPVNSGQRIQYRIDPATLAQWKNTIGFAPTIVRIQVLEDVAGFLGLSSVK